MAKIIISYANNAETYELKNYIINTNSSEEIELRLNVNNGAISYRISTDERWKKIDIIKEYISLSLNNVIDNNKSITIREDEPRYYILLEDENRIEQFTGLRIR